MAPYSSSGLIQDLKNCYFRHLTVAAELNVLKKVLELDRVSRV